jgi:hypothetical protein
MNQIRFDSTIMYVFHAFSGSASSRIQCALSIDFPRIHKPRVQMNQIRFDSTIMYAYGSKMVSRILRVRLIAHPMRTD